MYYWCRENKSGDQLCGYRDADLRLCFHICKKILFSHDTYFLGTSVDMESDHYIWTSQLTNVKVSLQNLAMEQLRPDRDIILPGGKKYFLYALRWIIEISQ